MTLDALEIEMLHPNKDQTLAALTEGAMLKGIVAKASGPLFENQVFYLSRGKRHWIMNGEWFSEMGFRWPEDVQTISDESLLTYLPGQTATRRVNWHTTPITNVAEAREAAASSCRGTGLEIGAGGNPFPVPLDCHVAYGDMYTYEELIQNAYPGQPLYSIVAPSIKTDLDSLKNVCDDSLDFIVACHVIEHTKNPIGSIVNAYSKLRKGGHLVLTIPDKERTFDRNRAVTTLEHLVEDYCNPDPERDKEHYRDFFANAENFAVPPDQLEEKWQKEWREDYSIHFHTWTYESFGTMVKWVRDNIAHYSDQWAHPCLNDGIEFYYTLSK
ncbi:methyltransferase domain-containing protein [Methylobacterium brachiatum]|uniref:methyltransferase domain-containing protein n=1 Tax=Methylobacterium brachiatum TaxID=269660 RepID=UPI002449CC0C|nr:methyltransferase domain-containing protein [Methylobacterium brachiatum]MDH2310385.1 methyltransferase domain-containing protein [Methylobacterium brachiatum]